MRPLANISLLVIAITTSAIASDAKEPQTHPTPWGTLTIDGSQGRIVLSVDKPAARIDLPTPSANITSATLGPPDWETRHLVTSFNKDATVVAVHLPQDVVESGPATITLRTAEKTQQFPDGRIVLSALDAAVVAAKNAPGVAKLETHPGNHRIGFWSQASDEVHWTYKATRPAKYRVQLTYSLAGNKDMGGSDIVVSIGETKIEHTLEPTTSWYHYVTHDIGEAYLPKPVKYTVATKCATKRGGAVMNLKAITLVPTCEGKLPQQVARKPILLHAKDITANGKLLQWEPKEVKRTLGYWANADDYAYWDFRVATAGKYSVQILQGCGPGHGGSIANFDFYTHNSPGVRTSRIPHTVQDTGHWQNFEAMELGIIKLDAGKNRLRVSATKKAKAAVMDLRQVLLTPVAD